MSVGPEATLTIGIKALNEEAHIAASLASACAAAAPFGGDVVLADCGSTDRTIEIAANYPVRIVQLADPAQKSCGTGAQLAFQEARGAFFYLLDGDMVLQPRFLAEGVAFLRANPEYAAVGGLVRQANTESLEFELRAETENVHPAGEVDRLDCGGLYRVEAIRSVGHFADRNLHSFEEYELGVRLRAKGWKLARIEVDAVEHYGHTTQGYHLILNRLRSGYAGGSGEVVRAALGKPHLAHVLRGFPHLRKSLIIWAWWLALFLALATGRMVLAACIFGVLLAYFAWRYRGLRLGLYTMAAWNMHGIGLAQGLLRPRLPVNAPIPRHDLSEGAATKR